MNINKIVIYITITALVLIVGAPSLYKIIKSNESSKKLVSEKFIIETSEKCFYEGKCKKTIIYLKDLYDNKYLTEEVIDPISKVVYDELSYVKYSKDGSTFYPVK